MASTAQPSSPPPAPASAEEPTATIIEVDTAPTADSESAYSSEISTYSTSLSSSVRDYEWQLGRRYHAYRAGAYKFPNDEKEQNRLDMFHHLFTVANGGRLHRAPFEPKDARVLDIGTGTGIWAIDMGDRYPEAALVVGVDLSPIQPSWVPPNVRFTVDDVEQEWTEETYDYIHSRYMTCAITDWPRLIRQAFAHLNPGGWAEFEDFDIAIRSDDGTLPSPNVYEEFYGAIDAAMRKINREADVGPRLQGWVKEAGFERVEHTIIKMPIGTWPKEKKMKEMGAFGALQFIDGAEAVTLVPLTQQLGWTKTEVEVLCAKVNDLVKDRSVHAYFQFHIVWGQKPQ